MVLITPEQLEALAQAGGASVEIVDPSTNRVYLLLDREVVVEPTSLPTTGTNGDPLLTDSVTFDGATPVDLSARHDDYLYGSKS
jgi:hypothetical protein